MAGIDRFGDKERRKQRRRLRTERDKKKKSTPGTKHWYEDIDDWDPYTVDDIQ